MLQFEELDQAGLWLERGQHLQSAPIIGQHDAAGVHVQQDDGPLVRTCRKSMTSNSATSVSANSTNVSAINSSRFIASAPLQTVCPGPGVPSPR